MIIKVCGLREAENIKEVASISGVTLAGMIFYEKSSRFAELDNTSSHFAELEKTGKVGVFVNSSPGLIAEKCRNYRLDFVQLHGAETPEYLKELKKILPPEIKFIKAFQVGSEKDILQTVQFEGLCEYFLFDTPSEGYGGSGKAFNWELLNSYKGKTQFLLSGGIGPESIGNIKRFKHNKFAGVDLNSRFETAPAVKNIELLSEFIQQLKSL